MNELEFPLRGVIAFPVTPFTDDLSVDFPAFQDLIAWMSRYPFAAIVAAGGAGEFFSLSRDEVDDVVRAAVEAAAGAVPVIGTVGASTAEGARAARKAAAAGAAGVLILPPYYTNADEDGMVAYYEYIGAATELPVGIYSRDWASFSPSAVTRLCERIPNLAFWKDGQGDLRTLHRIMIELGDRVNWIGGIGDDCTPGYFSLGIEAYTSGFASVVPELSFAIAAAGIAGEFDRLRFLVERYVQPLYGFRTRRRGYEISAIKEAMKLLGRDVGPVRPPLISIAEEDRADFEAAVEPLRRFKAEDAPAPMVQSVAK